MKNLGVTEAGVHLMQCVCLIWGLINIGFTVLKFGAPLGETLPVYQL